MSGFTSDVPARRAKEGIMPLEEGWYVAPRGLEVYPVGELSPPFWKLDKEQEFEFRDGYVWTDDFIVRASAGTLQGALEYGWIENLARKVTS